MPVHRSFCGKLSFFSSEFGKGSVKLPYQPPPLMTTGLFIGRGGRKFFGMMSKNFREAERKGLESENLRKFDGGMFAFSLSWAPEKLHFFDLNGIWDKGERLGRLWFRVGWGRSTWYFLLKLKLRISKFFELWTLNRNLRHYIYGIDKIHSETSLN